MYLEAFTHSKDPTAPHSNEDRLVIYGDRLFSVIDGVTDKSGMSYEGRRGGQLAGQLIEDALREIVDTGVEFSATATDILRMINDRFRAEYRRRGLEQRMASEPVLRFGAQLAALFTDGERIRLLHVGDCGVIIDGKPLPGDGQPGDSILSFVRSRVYHQLGKAGSEPGECLALARAAIVDGLDGFSPQTGALTPGDWSQLREQLLAELPAAFPDLPAEHVLDAARGGLKLLAEYRNKEHPLGHGCIDGTPVPDSFISDTSHSWTDVSTVEIYSDGYFGRPAAGGTVAAWEAHLLRIENEDPQKVNTVPSTKGSAPGRFTDDRTVLILRKEASQHVPV